MDGNPQSGTGLLSSTCFARPEWLRLYEVYRGRAAEMDDNPELVDFYQLACKAERILELGVWRGHSTSAFLAGCAHGGGELWSVDVNEPDVPRFWHGLPFWHTMTGDDLDPRVFAWCPRDVDVLLIDTSHQYEQTKRELERYPRLVRPGGLIVMDDTRMPGVRQALDESWPGWQENERDTPHGSAWLTVSAGGSGSSDRVSASG